MVSPAPAQPPVQPKPFPRSPGFTPAFLLPPELRGVVTEPIGPAAPPTSPTAAHAAPLAPPTAPTGLVAGREGRVDAFRSLTGTGEPPRPPAAPVVPPPRMAPFVAGRPGTGATPAAAFNPPARAVPETPRKPLNLEWIIGTRGLAAAGALAVVIGVIFFLKYAVEQGWISHLPPIVRCLCGVAFGGALVAVGEAARRKINAIAGAGLYAAGIACAYASVYAGYGYFDPPVIPQGVAFVALAAISALGIALSATTRLASVAIVSLVGAYLAPFLMHSANPNPLVFPVYAGALLATGLVLSAWLRGSFRWVGRSVWWATMIIGGAWGASTLTAHPVIVIGFVLSVWAMIHAAHIAAARGQFVSDEERDRPPPPQPFFSGTGAVLSSFSVTGWATTLAVVAVRVIHPAIDWTVPCGMTAATGVLAVWLAGNVGVIRNKPRTDAERLGACLALQSASALIGTIALATSSAGPAAALLWLCMGLAAVFAGRWTQAVSAVIYGAVLMTIGTARLVLWDSWSSNLFSPTIDFAGFALSPWFGWALGAAAVWMASGWVISLGTPAGKKSIWGALNAGVGVAMLVASLVHHKTDPAAFTWGMLALCGLLMGLHKVRPQLALHVCATVLLTLTTAKVVLVDVLGGRVPAGAPRLLGLPITASMVLCLGVAAVWAAFAVAARATIGRHPRAVSRATACSMVAVLVLLLAPISQDVVSSHLVWPWALAGIAVSLAARFERRLGLRIGAALAAYASLGAWSIAWVVSPGFTHWSTQFPVLLHPGLLSGVAAACSLVCVAKVARPSAFLGPVGDAPALDALPLVSLCAAGALAWLASSFEASRIAEIVTGSVAARGAAVSIWWGLLAVGLLLAGFRRSIPGLRYTGLALLGMAGVKVVLMDMAGAPQLARVAGFVTLGLLMLGTAVGYARVAKMVEGEEKKSGRR